MMSDTFEARLASAARAGWCTVILGIIMMCGSWLGYLWIMHTRPDWIRTFWGGGDLSWDQVQTTCIWFFSVFKLLLWAAMMGAMFLTLWARNLNKAA